MEFTTDELEDFAQSTEVFMAILDRNGLVLKANQRWSKKFGKPLGEFVSTPLSNFLYEGEKQRFVDLLKEVSQKGIIRQHTIKLVAEDSEVFDFRFDLSYKNERIYFVGFDVTIDARQYQALVEMSELTKTGAWTHDPVHNITFWSKQNFEVYEIDEHSDLSKIDITSFYDAAAAKQLNELIDRLYEKHESYDFSGEITTSDNNRKWIRTIARPIVHHGKLVMVQGVSSDQTLLHSSLLKSQRESETRLLALKGIRSGLFDHNLVTDLVFYSPDFKEIIGLPTDKDLPEAIFREMIYDEDRDEAYGRHLLELEKEDNFYFNHYRLLHRKEGFQHYEVYGWIKKDENGKPVRLVGNLINVEEKIRAQKTTEETLLSLRAMVNNGYIYSILMDIDTNVIMADNGAEKIIRHEFGRDVTKETIPYMELMPEVFQRTFLTEFAKALQGKSVRKEVERPLLDGRMEWLDILYQPVFDSNGAVSKVLLNMLNITERKHAEVAVKEAKDKAMALAKLKSTLLSNVSHEIKTPLSAIMSVSELLRKKEHDSEASELLALQKESEARLLKVVEDLVQLSDIDSLKANMTLQPHRINEVVTVSFETYQYQAKMKGLTYELRLLDPVEQVLLDDELFKAGLNAVIHNAIKFTDKGKVEVSVLNQDDRWIEVSISDTGRGISEDNFEKIFENFESINFGMNLKYEGTGIGLSIAKQFVQLLGGSISVDSVEGVGSTFTLRVPIFRE